MSDDPPSSRQRKKTRNYYSDDEGGAAPVSRCLAGPFCDNRFFVGGAGPEPLPRKRRDSAAVCRFCRVPPGSVCVCAFMGLASCACPPPTTTSSSPQPQPHSLCRRCAPNAKTTQTGLYYCFFFSFQSLVLSRVCVCACVIVLCLPVASGKVNQDEMKKK